MTMARLNKKWVQLMALFVEHAAMLTLVELYKLSTTALMLPASELGQQICQYIVLMLQFSKHLWFRLRQLLLLLPCMLSWFQ